MKSLFKLAFLAAMLTTSGSLYAIEKTVTLAVENMYCAACPYMVKQSLIDIDGVNEVKVSYQERTATVTFDDAQTNIEELTEATTDLGYPSTLVQ